MTDIWGLSDGNNAADTGVDFEIAGGGNFDVIPDGSKVLAVVENAEWKTDNEENEFLNLQWTVVKPEEVANRKIFQKLWITDDDPRAKDADKKRDKARRMFAAIDANAGGKLAKKGGKPDADGILLALANRPMVIRLAVWSMADRDNPGEKIEGNWVSAVAPKSSDVGLTAAKPKAGTSQRQSNAAVDDDEIPF